MSITSVFVIAYFLLLHNESVIVTIVKKGFINFLNHKKTVQWIIMHNYSLVTIIHRLNYNTKFPLKIFDLLFYEKFCTMK